MNSGPGVGRVRQSERRRDDAKGLRARARHSHDSARGPPNSGDLAEDRRPVAALCIDPVEIGVAALLDVVHSGQGEGRPIGDKARSAGRSLVVRVTGLTADIIDVIILQLSRLREISRVEIGARALTEILLGHWVATRGAHGRQASAQHRQRPSSSPP